MHVQIPIRNINIRTFTFLELYGVVGEAFQLGIDKAVRRRTKRKGIVTPPKDPAQRTTKRPQQLEADNKLFPM
jgi:hypothetical protein